MNLWIRASGFQALRTRTLTPGAEKPRGGLGEPPQPPALPCWAGRRAWAWWSRRRQGWCWRDRVIPGATLQVPWGWRPTQHPLLVEPLRARTWGCAGSLKSVAGRGAPSVPALPAEPEQNHFCFHCHRKVLRLDPASCGEDAGSDLPFHLLAVAWDVGLTPRPRPLRAAVTQVFTGVLPLRVSEAQLKRS